jgi:hypothetical protein
VHGDHAGAGDQVGGGLGGLGEQVGCGVDGADRADVEAEPGQGAGGAPGVAAA